MRCVAIIKMASCFNTQPPEGGWLCSGYGSGAGIAVSTHSRLKAAGPTEDLITTPDECFNTQPPEGGWANSSRNQLVVDYVSTHSRLKAAGQL